MLIFCSASLKVHNNIVRHFLCLYVLNVPPRVNNQYIVKIIQQEKLLTNLHKKNKQTSKTRITQSIKRIKQIQNYSDKT